MAVAIYPGSFDPITNGHLDVLVRASKIFDKVIIAVLENPGKNVFFPSNIRVKLIRESVSALKNVDVDNFSGLTVEYAAQKNANVLIRGLRAISDFEYEMQMAQTNQSLNHSIDTIFLVPQVENNFVSSSIVKEVARLGGDVSRFVPEPVNTYLKTIHEKVI